MNYPNGYQRESFMDIIALFCDIDYCLFLKDKQGVAYSMEGDSAGWDLYVFLGLRECHSYIHRITVTPVCSIGIDAILQ